MVYLRDIEVNEFRREDHYLAQIAAEVRRSFVTKPIDVSLDDFLLKFLSDTKEPVREIEDMTALEVEEKIVSNTLKSKNKWFALVNGGKDVRNKHR